jgi:hypothetical protein
MPNKPNKAMRRQCDHKGLLGRNTQAARGSNSIKTTAQRSKLNVMGGTCVVINRPTTALPAHSKGGVDSNKAVLKLSRVVMVKKM